MNTVAADSSRPDGVAPTVIYRHTRLVRITHWINALSFLFLVPSGIAILLAHPEFYWGEDYRRIGYGEGSLVADEYDFQWYGGI